MGYAIAHAEAVLKLQEDAEAKSEVTEKYNELIAGANKDAEEARAKKLKNSFWTGATIAGTLASAGFAARGLYEWYSGPDQSATTEGASSAGATVEQPVSEEEVAESVGVDKSAGTPEKSVEEFAVFKGKGVRILPVDSEEWISGIIKETGLEKVRIQKGNETVDIEYSAVRKAKLDYS